MSRFSWQREGAGRAKLVACPRCEGHPRCDVCGGEGLALRADAERWIATEGEAAEWEEATARDLDALLDYMLDLREPSLALERESEKKRQRAEREAAAPWLVVDERATAMLAALEDRSEH